MNSKPWWQSKTIWANALALLGTYVAPQLGVELKAEEQVAILVVVNLVLRLATKGAVDWSKSATPLLLAFCLSSSVLGLASCSTLRQIARVNLPFVQTEAQLACGAALQLAVSDADRRDVANMIFSVADAVDTLSDGTAPTPDEFTAKINALGIGSAEKYAGIASAIGGVWSKFYASLSGDPQLALQVMQRISAGCCDAARPYLTTVN